MHSTYRVTSEEVIKRIKDALKNPANKIEGSFAADNAQAVGKEIAKYYAYMEWLQSMHYALTAEGEWLDKKGVEHGVFRKKATQSTGVVTFTGAPGTVIPTGFKVYSDTQTFEVVYGGSIGDSGSVDLSVRSVERGVNVNVPIGAIEKADSIDGLRAVRNDASITGGTDDEDDESLRERLLLRMRYPGTSGNKYHYLHWAMEVDGVGRVKVFPEWSGPGTVKVSILDRNQGVASQELMQKVKDHIDVDNGTGDTLAPIGATLTVSTATAISLNIEAKITGVDETVKPSDLMEVYAYFLKEYFTEIAYTRERVTVAKLIDILWRIDGVGEILSLQVNGGTDNIAIGEEEIPVVGSVVLK